MKGGSELFKIGGKEYGENYREHLLEQYQLYVNGMEKISDRRQNANNYFITVNTVLISFIGVLFQIKVIETVPWVLSTIALLGIIICAIFWFLLRSHKQLNTAKFKVIQEIEQELPIAIYDYEWRILGEGKNKKLYYPFSHIEMVIPWVFGCLYLILGVLFLIFR